MEFIIYIIVWGHYVFFVLKNLIILFSKDTLNWSKGTFGCYKKNIFQMQLTLSIHQRILKKGNDSFHNNISKIVINIDNN